MGKKNELCLWQALFYNNNRATEIIGNGMQREVFSSNEWVYNLQQRNKIIKCLLNIQSKYTSFYLLIEIDIIDRKEKSLLTYLFLNQINVKYSMH